MARYDGRLLQFARHYLNLGTRNSFNLNRIANLMEWLGGKKKDRADLKPKMMVNEPGVQQGFFLTSRGHTHDAQKRPVINPKGEPVWVFDLGTNRPILEQAGGSESTFAKLLSLNFLLVLDPAGPHENGNFPSIRLCSQRTNLEGANE